MRDKTDLINELFDFLQMIHPINQDIAVLSQRKWDAIAKPLRSLGMLERAIIKVAAIQEKINVNMDKKAVVVMCADHGVVAEGVTQTDSSVTRIVAENLAKGCTSVDIMAERAGVDVFPVDIGMLGESYENQTLLPRVICDRKIAQGTGDIAIEPAMSLENAIQAVLTGIDIVRQLKDEGYQMIGIGEMGIGNTTPSSAIVSVLLDMPAREVTGRGAGLSDVQLKNKVAVIERAINRYWQSAQQSTIDTTNEQLFKAMTGIEILSELGGYEIAGMAGVCLGGAIYHVPIVLDGFISAAAALVASLISSLSPQYMLASHVSAEPAAIKVLKMLGLEPPIQAGLCLGEGTGAIAVMPLFDMAAEVYRQMSTFDEIHVEQYTNWEK